jgi:hypothetical protein
MLHCLIPPCFPIRLATIATSVLIVHPFQSMRDNFKGKNIMYKSFYPNSKGDAVQSWFDPDINLVYSWANESPSL